MICKSFGLFSCLIDRIDGYLLEVVAGCLDEDREERASVARERWVRGRFVSVHKNPFKI
jgi:hypothetical protein